MQIVVSADIGEVGPTDGKAVTCHFSPLYRVQGIIPWLLLPLAFVVLKENRSPQAAWILVPVTLLGLIYLAAMQLLQMDSGSVVQLDVMFTILVVGFSMVWLLAERIGNRNRFVTCLLAALVYFGFLGVNLLSSGFGEAMIRMASVAAISIAAIVLAFIVAALSSPKPFNTARFVIYIGAALFGSLLITFSAAVFIFCPRQNVPVNTRITETLIASFFCSLVYYAGLLPFLVMLCANPF